MLNRDFAVSSSSYERALARLESTRYTGRIFSMPKYTQSHQVSRYDHSLGDLEFKAIRSDEDKRLASELMKKGYYRDAKLPKTIKMLETPRLLHQELQRWAKEGCWVGDGGTPTVNLELTPNYKNFNQKMLVIFFLLTKFWRILFAIFIILLA